MDLLSRNIPHGTLKIVSVERAKRNHSLFTGFLKYYKITPEAILQMSDKNADKILDVKELGGLMEKLKFRISTE